MKIAHCLPDQRWIEEIRGENSKDAAYIQQKYIADGLCARGCCMTWIAPLDFDDVCVSDLKDTKLALRTWTANSWFGLVGKVVWKIQQLLNIPYLNYFSNLRRYDACMQILPGHDVAFERNSLCNSGVAFACKRLSLPYVMFFDADQIAELDFMSTPLTGLLRWRAGDLLRYNLEVACRVICVSEIARNHLIKTWGVASNKIVVLPNAVDVERFKPDLKRVSDTRESIQLTDDPLIIFVGNFYIWHDITTLLHAFSCVLKSHKKAQLLIVGDGMLRDAMVKLSDSLGMNHAVRFTGFVKHEEVPHLMNAADIAIAPVPAMEQEIWLSPMKLFEYMASGKAVIASATGQIKDIIKDGKNGLLVPSGDETALADAIIRLIENPALRIELGKHARETAVQNHSWNTYLSYLEEIFIDAMK